MRIWTLHPQYLDRQGLLALWREGLLAQAVLRGKTRGYRHHPQLVRFRSQRDALAAIATYLVTVHSEAVRRGYAFDAHKIDKRRTRTRIAETSGQLQFEWQHLKTKLRKRSNALFSDYAKIREPLPHPLFRIVPGPVRKWERGNDNEPYLSDPRECDMIGTDQEHIEYPIENYRCFNKRQPLRNP